MTDADRAQAASLEAYVNKWETETGGGYENIPADWPLIMTPREYLNFLKDKAK